MGIYDNINKNIGAAFSGALSDAVQDCTYIDVDEVYDPITGGNVTTKTPYLLRGVFSFYKSSDIGSSQGAIKTNDRKIIILDSELASPELKVNDEVNLGSEVLKVVNIVRDPAMASVTLQVRSNG